MGTKSNPGAYDCYENALEDEPMFILLGRDPHGAAAVRKWAADRAIAIATGEKPASDAAMIAEALQCADMMEDYHAIRERQKFKAGRP